MYLIDPSASSAQPVLHHSLTGMQHQPLGSQAVPCQGHLPQPEYWPSSSTRCLRSAALTALFACRLASLLPLVNLIAGRYAQNWTREGCVFKFPT